MSGIKNELSIGKGRILNIESESSWYTFEAAFFIIHFLFVCKVK